MLVVLIICDLGVGVAYLGNVVSKEMSWQGSGKSWTSWGGHWTGGEDDIDDADVARKGSKYPEPEPGIGIELT